MENARAKGKHIGRPETTLDSIPDKFMRYYALYRAQNLSVAELARLAVVSRPTVYKYIQLIEKRNLIIAKKLDIIAIRDVCSVEQTAFGSIELSSTVYLIG